MELDELQPLCEDNPEQVVNISDSEDLDAEPLLHVSFIGLNLMTTADGFRHVNTY